MDDWRNNFVGVQTFHKDSNFLVFGAIDDVWVKPNNELIIVDYKSTAKNGEINLDADWQIAYKRQMEIYQWLFRQNEFKVSDVGYFVYANGKTDKKSFDKKLEFDIHLILYKGNDSWIEETLIKAQACLMQDKLPEASHDCDFCDYRNAASEVLSK